MLSKQNNNHMSYNKVTLKYGNANGHHSKGTHWEPYTNKTFFDSPGWPAPENLADLIVNKRRK